MTIQAISILSFKGEQKSNTTATEPQPQVVAQSKSAVSKQLAADTISIGNKTFNKKDIKKYTLIGAGILLAGLLIFKGKSILKLFKKKPESVKPAEPNIPSEPVKPEGPSTSDKPKVEPEHKQPKPVVPQNRYELYDEYEKRTQAISDFKKRVAHRKMTEAELEEEKRLLKARKEIKDQIVPKHQSLVKIKTQADFPDEASKKDYIIKYVIPRSSASEESALDALDMFKEFGFKGVYSKDVDTTISALSLDIRVLPKQCQTEKVLNRYLDVMNKYADNIPSTHPDDEQLNSVIYDFVKSGNTISDATIVDSIHTMKKVICQRSEFDRLKSVLNNSKYKDSESVQKALSELDDYTKNMRQALTASDRLGLGLLGKK